MSEAHSILACLHQEFPPISVQAETLEKQQCASATTEPTAYSRLAGDHHVRETAEACLDSKHETWYVYVLCPYFGSSRLQMTKFALLIRQITWPTGDRVAISMAHGLTA